MLGNLRVTVTVCTVVKSKVKVLQNFVAFSAYMNFIDTIIDKLRYIIRLLITVLKDSAHTRSPERPALNEGWYKLSEDLGLKYVVPFNIFVRSNCRNFFSLRKSRA